MQYASSSYSNGAIGAKTFLPRHTVGAKPKSGILLQHRLLKC